MNRKTMRMLEKLLTNDEKSEIAEIKGDKVLLDVAIIKALNDWKKYGCPDDQKTKIDDVIHSIIKDYNGVENLKLKVAGKPAPEVPMGLPIESTQPLVMGQPVRTRPQITQNYYSYGCSWGTDSNLDFMDGFFLGQMMSGGSASASQGSCLFFGSHHHSAGNSSNCSSGSNQSGGASSSNQSSGSSGANQSGGSSGQGSGGTGSDCPDLSS